MTTPTFSTVPRFPPEILEQIFDELNNLTPAGRLLEIRLQSHCHTSPLSPSERWDSSYYTPTPAPLALYICSQSRLLAMKRWTLALATQGNPPIIWVDFNSDILFFKDESYYVFKAGDPAGRPSFIDFNLALSTVERARIRHAQFNFKDLHKARRRITPSRGRNKEQTFLWGVLGFLARTFPQLDILRLDWAGVGQSDDREIDMGRFRTSTAVPHVFDSIRRKTRNAGLLFCSVGSGDDSMQYYPWARWVTSRDTTVTSH